MKNDRLNNLDIKPYLTINIQYNDEIIKEVSEQKSIQIHCNIISISYIHYLYR